MTESQKTISRRSIHEISPLLLKLPWLEIAAETWKLVRQLWRGMSEEGIYEVLEYESTLELLDTEGENAHFKKREKIRYLNPTNGLPLLRRSPRKKQ
jgi:hypothetical protein